MRVTIVGLRKEKSPRLSIPAHPLSERVVTVGYNSDALKEQYG